MGCEKQEPQPMRATLADGRDILYFDDVGSEHPERVLEDPRELPAQHPTSEIRKDPLTGEWVAYATHRMDRTFMPPANENPLAPSQEGQLPTEVPSPDYDVVVFENRFPSFSTRIDTTGWNCYADAAELVPRLPAQARCEVVCFSPDPNLSFADLSLGRIHTIIQAWAHRTAELSLIPGVKQVFPFENRGEEIGVTLQHPHGQIYSYPFLTPRAATIVRQAKAAEEQGHDLFENVLAMETTGERLIMDGKHFVVFVPAAAKWPVEVMVMPKVARGDLSELCISEKAELAGILKQLYGAFDRFFPGIERTPYIAAWNQAPVDPQLRKYGRLHLQMFSLMRSPHRMKYLASSESAQGVWINDTTPETIAARFREIWKG
ncbi:MAG: galactose-1-phosphate uridylyltransferase [Corynebacterium sp.]|nr:galactose-1-phosphate uridylyltransferase [Corynebacterium sp.]